MRHTSLKIGLGQGTALSLQKVRMGINHVGTGHRPVRLRKFSSLCGDMPASRLPLLLIILALIASACGTDARHTEDDFEVGETILTIDFADEASFETGDYEEAGASLSIEDGRYRLMQAGERTAYIWGQGGEEAANVIVEAVAAPQSDFANNLYGVMCRVNAEGEGYAFLISNDGFGAIAFADKGAGTQSSLSFIFDWVESDAINEGQAQNTVRAVCIDDYLALYINGEFVGDVEDTRFSDPGQVGLIAGLFIESGDESGEAIIEFDDLTVSEGSLAN